MKKFIWLFIFVMVFMLVACESSDTAKANVMSEELNDYMLVVEIKLEGNITSLSTVNEAVTQVVNGIYAKYKEQFGTEMYTLIFEVYKDYENEDIPYYGSIGYKVNASIEEPGLSLIKNYLQI